MRRDTGESPQQVMRRARTQPRPLGKLALLALVALLGGVGAASLVAAQGAAPSRFNYRDHVRPLLEERCGACHGPGGAAQVLLLDYTEVVGWSHTLTMQVLEGRMPPWLPAEGVGDFRHARGLSAAEVDLLVDWAVGGLPQGEPFPYQEPEASPRPEGWHMGEPDLVLGGTEATLIDEEEDDQLHCVVLPTGLTEARLAQAFELKPGLRAVVQRATVTLGTSCDSAARPLFTWLPDQRTIAVAGNLGELLPAESHVAMEIFYRRGFDDEGVLEDRTEIAIRFSDAAQALDSVRVTDTAHSFPVAVELLALCPDPAPGTDAEPIRVEVRKPDGTVQTLLLIEDYEPTWREKYLLREPLLLEKGAELRVSRPALWLDFAVVGTADAGH